MKRHDRYRKMAEVTGSDKKAIQQQASAMMGSVLSQERVISYLRSLDLPAGDNTNLQQMADMIEAIQTSRQELINHFEFLGVAHDHGWDAAHIFREDPEDASKRVLNAVSKAKKKKEADDRERKRKKQKRSSTSSMSKRRREDSDSKPSCSHAAPVHCYPAPAYQPYQKQFRAGQNLPCIRCGDTAHHWRQCPKPATK